MRGAVAALLLLLAARPGAAAAGQLRVCADPNNLPFSNREGAGFENRIVAVIAQDLGVVLSYTWWAQRRGYVRNTLKAGLCDLWPGVASGVEMLATTAPYYRSTYVFVACAGAAPTITSLDDPRLRQVRVGVQMIGNDAVNTPPAHALARRGISGNVRGYSVLGDYAQPNPAASVIDAVVQGDVDVAIVWGPLAGYFAATAPVKLRLDPVLPELDGGVWPMVFDIAMGVRRSDAGLKQTIDRELRRRHAEIAAILADYHVPMLPLSATPEP